MSRASTIKTLTLTASLIPIGCTSVPTGPTVLVLQGTGKSFAQFSRDDTVCRRFASLQAKGMTPDRAALISGLGSDRSSAPTGAVVGPTDELGEAPQDLYNIAYIQCMYETGHRIPVPGHLMYEDRQEPYPPPPPPPNSSP